MRDEEKIRELLYQYEYAGLIAKSKEGLLNCFSEQVLGIGIGEQGFVTSKQELETIYEEILKEGDEFVHTLEFGRVEVSLLRECFGVACAEVNIYSDTRGAEPKRNKSQFQQSITVVKEQNGWKICSFHASTPFVTEESMEALPVKFAENTLKSLREKIGEEAYLAEEQYRKAVLADTIAFYIVNFTTNRVEKCRVDSDICVYINPDMQFEEFVKENTPNYVYKEDFAIFMKTMSMDNILEAFRKQQNELSCEYRMKNIDGTYFWVRTIMRLITDSVTGDRKGIMYVKNIENDRNEVQKIKQKADCDSMTGTFNKGAMLRKVDKMMQSKQHIPGGTFLMVDVDDFKMVNDTYGHPMGDRVLIAISNLLREYLGPQALVGRLGGDEFGVFLPGMCLDTEMTVQIERLLDTVRALRLSEIPDTTFSISLGGVYKDSGNFEKMYEMADTALYQAKKSGKNRACLI